MNAATIRANVARGVRLLDEKDPQWWQNGETPNGIKIDKLEMDSSFSCVLGQRNDMADRGGNPYSHGLDRLGLSGDDIEGQESYGFNLSEDNPAEWSALTEAWIAVIEARRHPRRRVGIPAWVQKLRKVRS